MTNFDRWRLYTRDLPSPDIFIEWGFYSMIGCALERRVQNDNPDRPLFANQYVLLVGPAGVGKGLVTDTVIDFLRHFKFEKPMTAAEKAMAEGRGKATHEYVFPFVADSITYEALMEEVVRATREYKTANGDVRMQAAMIMALDEFTSIFKRYSEDIVTYVNTAWNGKDYDRKTKKSGNNPIRKPILNIIAGTTPSEFAKLSRMEIVGNGFFARLILVYASHNRGRVTHIPPPDAEQRAAKQQLLDHLLLLSKVAADVAFSAEAREYLDKWFKDENNVIVNRDHRLGEYYARKITHLNKLCMVLHYSEPNWGKFIEVPTVQRAIDILARTEKLMHLALQSGGRNELGRVAQEVSAYITKVCESCEGPDFRELLAQFYNDCTKDELEDVLMALQAQHSIFAASDGNKTIYKPVRK
jgi:hypothetical protein